MNSYNTFGMKMIIKMFLFGSVGCHNYSYVVSFKSSLMYVWCTFLHNIIMYVLNSRLTIQKHLKKLHIANFTKCLLHFDRFTLHKTSMQCKRWTTLTCIYPIKSHVLNITFIKWHVSTNSTSKFHNTWKNSRLLFPYKIPKS
jgi:hypothetical protein